MTQDKMTTEAKPLPLTDEEIDEFMDSILAMSQRTLDVKNAVRAQAKEANALRQRPTAPDEAWKAENERLRNGLIHLSKNRDFVSCSKCHWIGTDTECEIVDGTGEYPAETETAYCPKCHNEDLGEADVSEYADSLLEPHYQAALSNQKAGDAEKEALIEALKMCKKYFDAIMDKAIFLDEAENMAEAALAELKKVSGL
jgi:hypothetical protein